MATPVSRYTSAALSSPRQTQAEFLNECQQSMKTSNKSVKADTTNADIIIYIGGNVQICPPPI